MANKSSFASTNFAKKAFQDVNRTIDQEDSIVTSLAQSVYGGGVGQKSGFTNTILPPKIQDRSRTNIKKQHNSMNTQQ